MDHSVNRTRNASHTNRPSSPNGSAGAQDTGPAVISAEHVEVKGGHFYSIGRDLHLHPSATHRGFEQAVNDLAKGLTLETVKLTPYFYAVRVGYGGFPALDAAAGMISSDHQPQIVPLSLLDENEKSFRDLASDILKKDKVELTLQGKFSLADHTYELNTKMSLDGLDSLQGAIALDEVKILSKVEGGLKASVKATIANRTRINIEHVTLKLADILYNSTKIGHHQDQTFKLLCEPPTNTEPLEFFWIFTPPPATDGDDDFRGFISKFLTTDDVIGITLDIQRLQIKAGDRLVELDGIKVKTSVKGIKKPLIARIDIYLGLAALRQEVSFRFKLVNPIHAPIGVIDSEVDATFKGHLLSHFVHNFKCLAVSNPLGEQDSEVVTAKLKNSLLRTIWLVRGRTVLKLEVNIQKTKISIGGHEIHNLEFKLHNVDSRIHFGKPAATRV